VKALLDAALVRRAVVQALESQGEPAIQELKAAAAAQGEARGVAWSILTILEARGIAATSVQREEILGCTDLERLKQWLLRAGVATSAEEVMALD
jgi:hypothetical protein